MRYCDGSSCRCGGGCTRPRDLCCSGSPIINPVINVYIRKGGGGTTPPRRFSSGYMEALGSTQTIATGGRVAFDAASIDSVGGSVTLNADGTVFTIQTPGLYHVEWNLNLAPATTAAVVGILENGEPATGAASSAGGSFSSGTLIQVTEVPFTLSLLNYGDAITIEDQLPFENTAASIRIVRVADGAART